MTWKEKKKLAAFSSEGITLFGEKQLRKSPKLVVKGEPAETTLHTKSFR